MAFQSCSDVPLFDSWFLRPLFRFKSRSFSVILHGPALITSWLRIRALRWWDPFWRFGSLPAGLQTFWALKIWEINLNFSRPQLNINCFGWTWNGLWQRPRFCSWVQHGFRRPHHHHWSSIRCSRGRGSRSRLPTETLWMLGSPSQLIREGWNIAVWECLNINLYLSWSHTADSVSSTHHQLWYHVRNLRLHNGLSEIGGSSSASWRSLPNCRLQHLDKDKIDIGKILYFIVSNKVTCSLLTTKCESEPKKVRMCSGNPLYATVGVCKPRLFAVLTVTSLHLRLISIHTCLLATLKFIMTVCWKPCWDMRVLCDQPTLDRCTPACLYFQEKLIGWHPSSGKKEKRTLQLIDCCWVGEASHVVPIRLYTKRVPMSSLISPDPHASEGELFFSRDNPMGHASQEMEWWGGTRFRFIHGIQ